MKIFFRRLLRLILKYLSILAVKKHSLEVIAVGGWFGTDIAREAVYTVLKHNGMKVRRIIKSPEVDWDIPLSILGIRYLPNDPFSWFNEILKACIRLIILKPNPSLLVLQINTKDPGIMKYWMSFVTPKVVIMLNSHAGTLNLELLLVEKLSENGCLILNNDNVRTKSLAQGVSQHVVYFGEKNNSEPDVYYQIRKGTDRDQLIIGKKNNEVVISKPFPEFTYTFLTSAVAISSCFAIEFNDACSAIEYFELPTEKVQNIFHKFIEE